MDAVDFKQLTKHEQGAPIWSILMKVLLRFKAVANGVDGQVTCLGNTGVTERVVAIPCSEKLYDKQVIPASPKGVSGTYVLIHTRSNIHRSPESLKVSILLHRFMTDTHMNGES